MNLRDSFYAVGVLQYFSEHFRLKGINFIADNLPYEYNVMLHTIILRYKMRFNKKYHKYKQQTFKAVNVKRLIELNYFILKKRLLFFYSMYKNSLQVYARLHSLVIFVV